MYIVCLDLEGVLIPEIWINFAQKTGIDDLLATTRDVPDYDVLMRQRLTAAVDARLADGPCDIDVQEFFDIATLRAFCSARIGEDILTWKLEGYEARARKWPRMCPLFAGTVAARRGARGGRGAN